MSYAGNSSLAPEVRERILSTFGQTLDLASKGSVQEAKLGCDFILRMDPDFEPARTLLGRLENAGGAVSVDDLRGSANGSAEISGEEPSADELFTDLDSIDLDDSLAEGAAGVPTAGSAAAPSLAKALEERLAQRDFAGVLELGKGAESSPEIARLLETAQARQEAVPYIQRFLEAARGAAGQGDLATARAHLEKALALDPSHPGVRELQEQIPGAPTALPDFDTPSQAIPDPTAAAPPGLASQQDEAQAAAATGEPGDRIGQLLAEGQRAFDAGDYQGAIDAWSRIFLIDVDHAEASERIEEARRLKAEGERQVEEVYHDALTRHEAGDLAGARAGFERVLQMQPSHLAAREQLHELERAGVDGAATGGPTSDPAGPPPMPSGPPPTAPAAGVGDTSGDVLDAPLAAPDEGSGTAWDLKQPILVPPEPGEEPAEQPARTPKAPPPERSGGRPGRRFLLIGSVVLLVALAAVTFFYLNRDRFFPNAQETEAVVGGDPIARATDLYEKGKADLALNLLRGVPAGTPRYEEAQALISQWEAAVEPDPEPEEPAGPTPDELATRSDLLAAARDAYSAGHYLEAQDLFDEGAAIAPLVEPDVTLRQEIEDLLAPVAPYVQLFREGEYEYALPDLWRLREDSPDDVVINCLIVDSYYNLAVSDLQRNDAESAIEKFEEVLDLAPDDRVAARHLAFAETYSRRNKDLLYRIYVKYLPRR